MSRARTSRIILPALLGLSPLVACEALEDELNRLDVGFDVGDTSVGDTGSDSAPDVEVDAEPDTVEDTAPDVDPDVATDTLPDAVEDSHADTDEDAHEEPHWSYEGESGPDFWGELSDEWALCGDGMEQSPIDIPRNVASTRHGELEFAYVEAAVTVENNGHTIQVNVGEDAGGFELEGTPYELVQFHFHAQSEHTVAGQHYPLEMHLVHRAAGGELAVVGVFLDADFEIGSGDTGPFEAIFDAMPAATAEPTAIDGYTLIPSELLPVERAHWHYDGSLTTPSCAEGVSWFVMWQPVRIAEAQIAAFRELHDGNFRPVQPLGERHIVGAHFEYEGEFGPVNWPELSPQWEECGYGVEQSPINFAAGTDAVDLSDFVVTNYSEAPLRIQNNGHTIQVDYSEGSTLSLDDTTYHVRQFHFHTHSEHQVADASFPMEMHIVHENDDGELAVLGVFMDVDTEIDDHAALSAVWDHLPATPTPSTLIEGVSVNVGDLLPEVWTGWRYHGSLTTPPCSEGVSWTVLETPIVISDEQRDSFAEIFENNARPTQELGDRVVNP